MEKTEEDQIEDLIAVGHWRVRRKKKIDFSRNKEYFSSALFINIVYFL